MDGKSLENCTGCGRARFRVSWDRLGAVEASDGAYRRRSLLETAPVLFDAVVLPGGAEAVNALVGLVLDCRDQ
jgi:hypothetical protein